MQLDNRLSRIEELLLRITPILESKVKSADSDSNGESNIRKKVDRKRGFPESEDESIEQESEEEDYDADNEEKKFSSGESDDDDQFSTVHDQSQTPEERSTNTDFLKTEGKTLELTHEAVSSISGSENNHSRNGNSTKRLKLVKLNANSANEQANFSKSVSSKPQHLSLDVPNVPNTITLVGFATSLDEINKTNPDIISATLLKTSENYLFSDTPFFFCTSTGLKWIADKTGDPTLASRFEKSFKSAHMSQFEQFRTSIEQCDKPYPLTAEMLMMCAEAFKSEISCIGFMSDGDVDMLIESELHPNPAEGKVNGFAEKIAIHCIVALGLVQISEKSHKDHGKIPYKTDLVMIRRQINSAYHYFFRFALIGNSIMGIKSLTLLSMCMLFSVSHSPSLLVLAVAVRLAQEIGLHSKRYTQNMPRLEAERLRRLWWALYCLEKNLNIMYSKPTTIIEDSISTPLPQFTPEIDLCHESEQFCFVQKTTQLYRIWARVSRTLEKIETQRLKEKEKMQLLIEIDRDLLAWSNSVPPHSRPGFQDLFDSYYSKMKLEERMKFRFHHTMTHTVYYFILGAIHRQVAYHPSWVYKVLRPTDVSETGSNADATPKSRSVIDSLVALKTFENKLDSAQATEKVHRSIVERFNNVKLVPKKIAADYPRFLRSFQLSVEYSRNTIDGLYRDKGSAEYFSLSFFLLNAFITLLIKCLMQPKDVNTPEDLVKMQHVIGWFKKLSFFTSDFMPPDQENFLSLLKESVARYVKRICNDNHRSDSSNDTSPAKHVNNTRGDTSIKSSSNINNRTNGNSGSTLQEPHRDATMPTSVSSPSLYSILNSTNVDPVSSICTAGNSKIGKPSDFDDQNNNFVLNNSDRPNGLTDVFSDFENNSNNAASSTSGPLDADILFRMFNGNNFTNNCTSDSSTYDNSPFHNADTNEARVASDNINNSNDALRNNCTDDGDVLPVTNEDSYDDYMKEFGMTTNDFNIFDSLYQLSSYWGTGEAPESSWIN